MQLTKVNRAETSCNQLLFIMINSSDINNVAMSLYDNIINETLRYCPDVLFGIVSIK